MKKRVAIKTKQKGRVYRSFEEEQRNRGLIKNDNEQKYEKRN